jgi:hypothetical protein
MGCQRDGVHAANADGYKPRPAPVTREDIDQPMIGELMRVNVAGKTFAVRVENGMVQTFKFDNNTVVTGIESDQPTCNSPVRNLVGKEGSDVVVQWNELDGGKIATNVEVAQVVTEKSSRHQRRPSY